MKKLLLSALALLTVCALPAQNNLRLLLSPRLGTAPFALDVAVSAGSYEYKITRLEYYISDIKITHDGGQETPLTDLYLLARPAADSLYDLGSHPEITNVEGITFSIGVDSAHNHLDPTIYPANHPLAVQDPSMHWGWQSGYRFMAVEGVAGNNFDNIFQIHSIGDVNYQSLTLPVAAEIQPNGDKTIHLIADYTQALLNIKLSEGLIAHGTTGNAAKLLDNMRNLVFHAATVATVNPAFEGSFAVSPNPASSDQAIAAMTLPAGFHYRITLTDLAGRTVLNRTITPDSRSFSFGRLHTGVYFAHLWQNERPAAVEKLIIGQ